MYRLVALEEQYKKEKEEADQIFQQEKKVIMFKSFPFFKNKF